MRRRVLAALAVTGLTLALAPATAAAEESPTPTVWRSPGEGARGGKAEKITGRSESLQQRRQPLVLIDEKRQGKKRSLTLSSDVLFAKDSAELTSSANDTLEEVAKRIKDSGAEGPVDVVGHTDTDGTAAHNQDLSTRRAKAVAKGLEPRLSGTDTELRPVGKGEKSPAVSPEKNEADKARNRRVTITYTTTKTESEEQRSPTDISVPATQPAQPSKSPKVEGSLGAYQRELSLDSGKATVQLDVMAAEQQGPFVYVRVRVTVLSYSGTGSFGNVEALFSGDTTVTNDAQNTVLYDQEGGVKLRYFVTGKGEPIRSSIPDSLEEGRSGDVWFYYTAPERDRDHLDLYVPGFGVITSLAIKS